VLYLPFKIALRYIRGRSGNLFSVNTRLSFAGVFSGTSLLVVVLAIFNGFQDQFKKSLFQFDPHLIIQNESGDRKIKDWKNFVNKAVDKLEDKAAVVEGMIQSPAILRRYNLIDYVFLRAQEFQTDMAGNYILPDHFPEIVNPSKLNYIANEDVCLVGKEMAILFDLRVGDKIELVVPRGQFSLKVGVPPSMRTYKIAGFFKTGYYEHDSRLVILPIERAQNLFNLSSDTVQQIVVRLNDLKDLSWSRDKLYEIFKMPYTIRTIEDEHRNFFAALKLEKTIQITIVFLFIIAAMVGIVVATYNVVRSKRKDIGILKSLGLSNGSILTIFTINGFLTGIFATIFGIMFGIFLSHNLESILLFIEDIINTIGEWYALNYKPGIGFWQKVRLIPKNVYYFDHLPIYYDIEFLRAVGFVSVLLSGIASFIPAWAASRMKPIEIIRGADS